MFWYGQRRVVAGVKRDAGAAGLMALRAIGVEIGAGAFLQRGRQIRQRGKLFERSEWSASSKAGLNSPSRFKRAELVVRDAGGGIRDRCR